MNAPEASADSRPPVPEWSTTLDACKLIARGITFRTAIKVALVVGTILSAVNQGGVIIHRDATTITWTRVIVNFLVPFTVASIGYLSPFRVHRSRSSSR